MGDLDEAQVLVAQFSRLVQRDGGVLRLEGVDDGVARVRYVPGDDASCQGDACVLPSVELQQLMAETLARRESRLTVVVVDDEHDRHGEERGPG